METCADLQAAFDLTETQDVVVEIHPETTIDCVDLTTMSIGSNKLTVSSSEEQWEYSGTVQLLQLRFEVTGGGKLVWETHVKFVGTDLQDANGGGVFVGEDSSVRFLYDLTMTDIGVRSVPEEGSDFASYQLSGGCVYVDGYFRVDGDSTFLGCEVSGGGESSPGPGGALYVGEEGSVLFNGELEISDVSIIDDEGNNGGGIYNLGKINIKGNAKFQRLRAEAGGAIFNAASAQFRFRSGATAVFVECLSFDGTGGALYNQGYFKFSGPALFLDSRAPSVFMSSKSVTVLSKKSVFWGSEDTTEPQVDVRAGGELVIPSSVSFVDAGASDCSTVYYHEDDSCL